MFAVVVFGVGAMMLAGMFVVSLSQSRLTLDETTGAAVARGAMATLQSAMTDANAPDTDGLRSIEAASDLWQVVRGNLIVQSTPQYAWTALYERRGGAPFAKVLVIVVRSQNQSQYDVAKDVDDDPNDVTGRPPSLAARPLDFSARIDESGNTLITIDPAQPNAACVGSDAYLVLSGTGDAVPVARIFRLGTLKNPSTGEWIASPGYGLKSAADEFPTARFGYAIGRGYVDPQHRERGFEGVPQDIGVYWSFVRLQ